MSIQKSYENAKKLLNNHRQEQLLAFWEQLDQGQRQNLLAQIERLDLAKIDVWVNNFIRNPASDVIKADVTPAMSYNPSPASPDQQRKYAEAVKLGAELIAAGKVAAFVVAGGQGTRLGFDGPKGNFPISPIKNKTLFRIFADSIAAVSQKYQTVCPWYVMTSPLNYDVTKEIFRSNNYYGLDEKNVFIFQQGTLPNFGPDGRILLADKAAVACSPDGHGGSLRALYQSGALDDMKKRGIEFMSYWQVDNPLINIFDPLFIGLHALDKAEMSSKALIKTGPKEKVGNFCLLEGKVTVIEYSDLPDELAERRNPDGSLVFELGSIAIHIINRTFVEKLNADDFSLPLHRAVKNIRHIDEKANTVESDGIKLESFVFDALPLASKSVILQTIRSEEFAPTKNAAGVDSVESTRRMMTERAADWLESAGVTVPRKPDGSVDCILEIAPSFAPEKEDIKDKLDQIPEIKRSGRIYIS
ncbi:MAG: UTP--glucose-1-phosphate uridylyltransferase [Planctomycetota bacterium]|jgi:UDP-N-acetylglucosamine/UDP-N-acetylgalactosamine diphosphorylase